MAAIGMAGPLELIILLVLGGGVGLPLGVPPGPEDPLLAKAAPEECLFYTSWSGMAEPDPNSPNQTEQLLAEPEVRLLVGELEKRIRTAFADVRARQKEMLRQARAEMGVGEPDRLAPDEAADAAVGDAIEWTKTLLTSPAALFVESVKLMPFPQIEGGVLVQLGEETGAELKETLERYQTMLPKEAVKEVQIGGDAWYRIQLDPKAPPTTWGIKGKYLIVGIGDESVEGIFARARTDAPEWLTDVREQLPVERMSTVTYINLKSIIKMVTPMGGMEANAMLLASGLDNVESLASVSGLDGEGFLGRSLVQFDGEPKGILAALTEDSLTAGDLDPIPADATVAAAVRLDLNSLLEAVISSVNAVEAEAGDELLRDFRQIREETGIDVQETLRCVGDRWRIYNSPSEGGLIITGLTAVVDVKDPKRLAIVEKKFVELAKAEFRQDDPDASRYTPRMEHFEFEDHDIYFFNARDDDFPLAPAWCLAGDQLIVAPFPQQIKAYLLRDGDHKPLGTVDTVAEQFTTDGGPVMMAYVDTKKLFELAYPLVTIFAQVIASEMQREGIDIDISILPSARAIAPHLRPGVMTVRRTASGIEVTNRQTIPGGNIGTTLPMMMSLFGARVRQVPVEAMPHVHGEAVPLEMVR